MSLEICSADFKETGHRSYNSDHELVEYFREQLGKLAGRFERMTVARRRNAESRKLLASMDGDSAYKEFCTKVHQGVFPAHRQLEAIKILIAEPKITDREFFNKLVDPPSIATIVKWRRRLDANFPHLNCLSKGTARRFNSDGTIADW